MRIITGTLKGRRFPAPPNEAVRPTSDRAKESLFSMLEARIDLNSCRILDLFAGSGNLGFEALSRGAQSVLFVDFSAIAIEYIQDTANRFGVSSSISTLGMPVETYLQGTPTQFDVIFADPPYDLEGLANLPDALLDAGWLATGGWMVLEHDKRHGFDGHPFCDTSRPYGRTIVSLFHPAIKHDV